MSYDIPKKELYHFLETLDFFCHMEDAVTLIERYKLNEGKSHETEYIYLQ
jgi:hypothetical protein